MMRSFVICTFNQKLGDQIKEDELSGACSTHGRDEICIQYSGLKTEETTRKT
jgi:hypothetical protein